MGVVQDTGQKKEEKKMGKSLNFIGKKCGKQEQLNQEKEIKEKKKEDYKKFHDSFPVEETPELWRCSACDEYYSYCCDDKDLHNKEWVENTRESVKEVIEKEYRKLQEGASNKNKSGYKV